MKKNVALDFMIILACVGAFVLGSAIGGTPNLGRAFLWAPLIMCVVCGFLSIVATVYAYSDSDFRQYAPFLLFFAVLFLFCGGILGGYALPTATPVR